MNTNNQNKNWLVLVISFAGMVAHARRVMSHNIQTNLFKMGFFWSPGGWDGKPTALDSDNLFICSHAWNPMHITHGDGPIRIDQNDGPAALVFNATTQSEEFLAAARDAVNNLIVFNTIIEGVQCVIRPEIINLNPTDLLARVGQEAERIRKVNFGR